MAAHDDFARCRPERQWKGRLDALFMALVAAAKGARPSAEEARAGKGWHWCVLPRGAFVGLRVRTDMGRPERFELRIARSGELQEGAAGAWEQELAVFLASFQLRELDGKTPATLPGGCWIRAEPVEGEAGRPVRRWLLLVPGEVRPGRAVCWDHLSMDPPEHVEVEWSPSYGITGQRCTACAMKPSADCAANPAAHARS